MGGPRGRPSRQDCGSREIAMPMANRPWIARAAVAAIVVLSAGCREAEQNRPLEFEPHVYKGEKLPALSEEQRRQLQERGGLQR